MLLAVRTRGRTAEGVAGRMREITARVSPTLRLAGTNALAAIERQQQLAVRLVALITRLFTSSVVLLSAAGIYAMMSLAVTQRRREIGIRAVLGARRHALLRSIFTRAIGQLAMGVVAGLVLAVGLDVVSGGSHLGGRAGVLLPTISLVMIAVGTVAALGPARRGLRIQPIEALRES